MHITLKLERNPEVVIGTPGRLWELISENKIDVSALRFLAIDEADRLVAPGAFPEFRKVVEHILQVEKKMKDVEGYIKRQTLMFSATLMMASVDLTKKRKRDEKEKKRETSSPLVSLMEEIGLRGKPAIIGS